jgi:hypothetical protein
MTNNRIRELENRVEQLESQLDDQQETVNQMLPSRRDLLKGAAGVGGAALLGSAATGSASAGSDEVGTIGTPSNLVDIEAEDINAEAVNTERIGNARHYAGTYDGSDADTRLDNALGAASDGDVVYLESTGYQASRTISTAVRLIGTNSTFRGFGTFIDGTTWTLDGRLDIAHVGIDNNGTLQANNTSGLCHSLQANLSQTVQCDATRVRIVNCGSLDITLQSNTADCVVANNTNTTVTDNGTNNVVANNS